VGFIVDTDPRIFILFVKVQKLLPTAGFV